MKKTLVILTIDFPDPLLEKELLALAEAFDRVYILPTSKKDLGQLALPAHVTVHEVLPPVSLDQPLRLLRKHFFSIVRIYAWTIFRRDNWRYYTKHYRSFLGYLLKELEHVKPLEEFVVRHNLQQSIFYDYWLVDSTLAMAELKRKGVIHHTIARTHGFDLYDERQFERRVPFRDYRIHHLDALFTISKHGYAYLANKLTASLFKKVKLSYLGIASEIQSLPTKRSQSYTVVSCSSLIPLKRVGLLVDALMHTKLPIHWIHFGDGPERQEIEKKLTLLPPNVRADLRGNTPNIDVLNFYANQYVDLFVSLSESEGLPVSMMEVISYGIPILACSINGIPEIVNERTGKTIPVAFSKTQIAEALEDTLLHVSFDRESIRTFFQETFDAQSNYHAFIVDIGSVFNTSFYNPIIPVTNQCTRCVLGVQDDPSITFDDAGVCSYCRSYDENERLFVKQGKEGQEQLAQAVAQIKAAGVGKPYDCILGISGGVDSTYLAYQAKQLGLRPLAVHFDNGWNSELAVKNIENIVKKLGFDLHTLVVDWEEFKDLQLSFFKASVIDIELPTDHAMLATLYKLALEKDITYILSGHNVVTESVLPTAWYFNKRDSKHIVAIHDRFGKVPLKTFPLITSALKFQVEWKRVKSLGLLNLMPYNKADVKKFIMKELDWRDYGGKHYESIFTRFYQGYVLIKKFGVDKRRAHLSNLICSRQITREEALDELQKPSYDAVQLERDYEFVLKKFELSKAEFETIMATPPKNHTDYPYEVSIYDGSWLRFFAPVWRTFKRIRNTITPSV